MTATDYRFFRLENRDSVDRGGVPGLLSELILRFVFGGFFVSSFALLGDALRPRSFAGLTGAAPSVALSSLILVAATKGLMPVAAEAKTMSLGVIAFFLSALLIRTLIVRLKFSWPITVLVIVSSWGAFTSALWFIGWR